MFEEKNSDHVLLQGHRAKGKWAKWEGIPSGHAYSLNWTYIRRSSDAPDIRWTSYLRPLDVVCSLGINNGAVNFLLD